jgi:hypothetical protein
VPRPRGAAQTRVYVRKMPRVPLSVCYAYHFAMSFDVDAVLRLYRSGFQPSPCLDRPQ